MSNLNISRFDRDQSGDRLKIRLIRFNEAFLKKYLIIKPGLRKAKTSKASLRQDTEAEENKSPLEKSIKRDHSFDNEHSSNESSDDRETRDHHVNSSKS